jgi:branched-chain amino acid transport system substrate-binding protein
VTHAKQEFYDAFKAAHRQPDVGATLAWDPALILLAAIRKAGPSASSEMLRTTIAGMTGFAGLNGLYDFRRNPQRGLDETDVVMARWDTPQHRWVVVSRPDGIPNTD